MAIDVAEAAERGIGRRASSRAGAVYSKQGKTFARMSGSIVDGLELFASQLPGIARKVAYAGARVMYDEMLMRAPVESGGLRDAIYHKFLDQVSQGSSKSYAIGPNKRRAPHWHLVEYGHYRYHVIYRDESGQWKTDKTRPLPAPVWVPAVPYIRPTFDARKVSAIEAMRARASELVRGGK
jgi:HK97 gp10 family phage protein